MKVDIYYHTPNPLELMGTAASKCWGSNPDRAVGIAKDCFETNHGRVSEFATLQIEISECSSRMIRELYTHIIGTSRLQESSRYVNMVDFKYIIPPTIKKSEEATKIYVDTMNTIKEGMLGLSDLGIHKEDYANLLPWGSHTKMVLSINVRALIHMAHERMCTRTYWEFRDLMSMIKKAIIELGDEQWVYIAELLVPKCDSLGYCTEDGKTRNCNRKPLKEDVLNV